MPAKRTAPVAQRLLIQLGSDLAQDTNARRLRESNPIDFRDGTPGSLVQGEVLHLLAHSGGDTFAGKSPYGLFQHLVARGLTSDRVSAVQLHGCESTDFAAMLEHFLNADDPGMNWQKPQGRPIKVRGIPGYSVVSTSGRNFSIGRAPEVKGQVLGAVLASLAREVETVNFDRFASQDLVSLGSMVDRVIAIMQMPVAPLGDLSRGHARKVQNEIRKKLREMNSPVPTEDVEPAEVEEGIDLDALGQFPEAAAPVEQPLDDQAEWDALAAELEALNAQWQKS